MEKTLYKIIFYFTNGPAEVYNGKQYYRDGKNYAGFCSWEPKLFKSKFQANKTANRLITQCINCSENLDHYEIIEVNETDIKNWFIK